MQKPRAYIETTIPSFHAEVRTALANANKFGHIRRVNTMLGLFVPALVTPLELLGESDEENGSD
jgi:hypothetical protein